MRRIFKKRFSMAEVAGLLAVVVVGAAIYAYAVTTVPHTFTAGTTAKADEVNENFQVLADVIDGLHACKGNSPDDIMVKAGPICVDKYEASVWNGAGTIQYGATSDDYPSSFPDNGGFASSLYAVSKAGVTPSRFITWFQAQQACAASGKRLLTNAEWQMVAAGSPDPGLAGDGVITCNTNTARPVTTGHTTGCVSNWGVHDMVGNVWEWVGDWMQGNTNPWAPSTGTAGTDYGGDLMNGTNPALSQGTNSTNFPAALIRGGWSGGMTAGVSALYAGDGPSVSGSAIGCRCAR